MVETVLFETLISDEKNDELRLKNAITCLIPLSLERVPTPIIPRSQLTTTITYDVNTD